MKALPLALLTLASGLLLGGCNYEFPLTAKPTRPVDERLLGDWTAVDKESAKPEHMKVQKLDDFTYVVAFDGDLYRASHSDFRETPLVSVQSLEPDNRKYAYFLWQLSADGNRLTLKIVNLDVLPDSTKDQAAMQELLGKNLANPSLFNEAVQFAREKPAKL